MTMNEMMAERVRMEKAWALVCPTLSGAKDWREPVRAFVNERELAEAGTTLEEVKRAIVFYTATEATVKEYEIATGGKGWLLTATGYRRGPAGP